MESVDIFATVQAFPDKLGKEVDKLQTRGAQ